MNLSPGMPLGRHSHPNSFSPLIQKRLNLLQGPLSRHSVDVIEFDETEEIEHKIQMSSKSTPSSCHRRRSRFMQKSYDSTDSSNCSGMYGWIILFLL